eukprot:2382598-Prymnesium_polylepis.1
MAERKRTDGATDFSYGARPTRGAHCAHVDCVRALHTDRGTVFAVRPSHLFVVTPPVTMRIA